MVKKALFFIIGLSILSAAKGLVLPSLARADDFVLSGYTEAGKRSIAEDCEEKGALV